MPNSHDDFDGYEPIAPSMQFLGRTPPGQRDSCL